jgi:hypothetical protein
MNSSGDRSRRIDHATTAIEANPSSKAQIIVWRERNKRRNERPNR